MRILSWLVSFFILAQSAHAYTVFTLNGGFDKSKTTDVYIVGYGPEMATLFLQAAVANALKQNEMYPEKQQLILWALDRGEEQDLATITSQNFTVLETNSSKLSMTKVLPYLKDLKSISSFHFFGHSSAWFGLGLQEGMRFDESSSKIAFMKNLFTADAYAILHGCNTGFFSAPKISKIWGIPVFGSLTSTDFQKLHKNGHWYHNNEGQYPTGGWASVNNLSFQEDRPCREMTCIRMKANNHPYTGHWGNYDIGLPFLKVFCDFEKNGKCSQGITKALLSIPSVVGTNSSPAFDEYKKIVEDLLCPRMPDDTVATNCRKILSGENPNARYFRGAQLNCDLKSCDFEVRERFTLRGKRREFIGTDAGNATLQKEYQLLLKAYEAPGSF